MEFEQNAPKIRVVIRKRPLSRQEESAGERDDVEVNGEAVIVREQRVKLDLSKYTEEHIFHFDAAFGESASNEQIYAECVRPIVDASFGGARVSCFAYGQTGSGKTYTMLGEGAAPGLYLLAADDVFALLAEPRHAALAAAVSYFEIYCGKLFDLLNGRRRLVAREDARQSMNIVDLRRVRIDSRAELFELIAKGNAHRVTSTTGKNADSSRSHAILHIYLMAETRVHGLLSFIDLAGNERGSDTHEHDERTRIDGAEIGKSLLALKECIRALDQNLRHVPFRGSKLTMVLKDSFVGNCRTLMIGAVSPASSNTEYTLNTLRYADRVKELKKEPKDRSRSVLMLPRESGRTPIAAKQRSAAPIAAESADAQLERHQKLVNEILDDEESLLKLHRAHAAALSRAADFEASLLARVDRPGSDLEEYVSALEQSLAAKAASLDELRTALHAFKAKLAEERRLGEQIAQFDSDVDLSSNFLLD